MIDRSLCAHPVLAPGLRPCGRPADVPSPEATHPWAYCQEHASKVLAMLRVEVQVDLSEGRVVAAKRQRLESMELALERA